jgi:hypothetical protein
MSVARRATATHLPAIRSPHVTRISQGAVAHSSSRNYNAPRSYTHSVAFVQVPERVMLTYMNARQNLRKHLWVPHKNL